MKQLAKLAVLMAVLLLSFSQAHAKILISGYMANPAGNDSIYEYVQLVATTDTDFSVTPYTLIWNNNGTATSAGWTAGGALTYAFSITSGSVTAGQVFYVGGSGKLINGVGTTDISSATWVKTINVQTTAGDSGGSVIAGTAGGTGGTLGNGGSNADGIAIFNVGIASITSSTVPEDAVFFGTGLGSAVVSSGTAGYQLPVNDRYSGGKLQFTSYIFGDPASGGFTRLTGTFDVTTDTWTTARTGTIVSSPTTLSAISSAITLSGLAAEPTTHASGVGFSGVASDAMTVSWTSGNGASRLVVARAGAAPTGVPVDGTGYSANANFGSAPALGDGKVVYNGTGSSFTLTGLSASTTYHVRIYEFNGSGSSANYLTSGSPATGSQTTSAASNSAESDIVRATGFIEPENLAYATYQATDITDANSIELARFTIRDGGAGTDADSVGTTLDAITFAVANGGNLRRVALYDGATEVAEVAGGTTVTFTGLTGLTAADGGTKNFSVRATFNATVTDNQQLQFTVTSATANASGSDFAAANAGGAASDTTGDRNRIEVTATKLAFSSVPASVAINTDFSASVQARDANENLDLDSTASVTITKASGPGTLTGGGAQNLVAGARTFATLQVSASGSYTLQASATGLTPATSGAIAANGPLSNHNLVVVRVGDESQALANTGNTVFLDEYTTNGFLIQTIAIPDSGSSALVMSGTATSEGALSRSPDRKYLTFAGYNIARPHSSSVSGATSASVPRGIGRIGVAGTFDLPVTTTSAFSGNNIRGSVTDGTNNYWGAGANSGTYYLGTASAAATVQDTVANTRVLNIFGGKLYFSTGSGTQGIYEIPGLPTSASSATAVITTSGSLGTSPYGFAIQGNTAYVADDTAIPNGGIGKWTNNGSAWGFAYKVVTNAARGLTVDFKSSPPVIYATTAGQSGTNNALIRVVDAGPTSSVEVLAQLNSARQGFRGVQFGPGNTAPVANADVAQAVHGSTNTIAGVKLLGNDTDADGDTLTITAATAASGSAAVSGGSISYIAPTSGASDTITYTISDGFGGTANGTIAVTLLSTNAGSLNLVGAPVFADNQFSVTFAGIPAFTYAVEQSTNSPTGPWSFYTNLTAGPNGLFSLVVTNDPPAAMRFFRTVTP